MASLLRLTEFFPVIDTNSQLPYIQYMLVHVTSWWRLMMRVQSNYYCYNIKGASPPAGMHTCSSCFLTYTCRYTIHSTSNTHHSESQWTNLDRHTHSPTHIKCIHIEEFFEKKPPGIGAATQLILSGRIGT